MSALSDLVKATVSMRDVAERCGFELNRGGYILCPFHADRTPSLKIYAQPGRGWYCYSCNAGGSVIDFVMRLNDMPYAQALRRLAEDFGLAAPDDGQPDDDRRSKAARERKERAAFAREYDAAVLEHQRLWQAIATCAPQSPDAPFCEKYAEAVKNIVLVEARLDAMDAQISRWRRSGLA